MLKLYGPRAGSSLRNHWLLAELNLEYQEVKVDLSKGEQKTPEFLKLNPTGQVPVLEDGEFVMAESLAINDYLAEKYNSNLIGTSAQDKAKVWQWSLWVTYTVQKHFYALFGVKYSGGDLADALKKESEGLKRYLQILDNYLGTRNFLVGDSFTLADINVATTLTYSEFFGYDFSEFSNVYRWFWAMTKREAYLKARAMEVE